MLKHPYINTLISIFLITISMFGFTRKASLYDILIPVGLILSVFFAVLSIIGFRKQAKLERDNSVAAKIFHNLDYVIIFIVLLIGLFFLILGTSLPPQD